MSSKRGTRVRTSLVVIALLLIVGFGVIISRRIFADVTDTCTGADVDLIPAAKGDFGTNVSAFDGAMPYLQTGSNWFYSGYNNNTIPKVPSIASGRLVIGSNDADPLKRPKDPIIYYKFATPLKKEKLYEFKVQFETSFGDDNYDKITPKIYVTRNGGEASGSTAMLKSTADGTLTEATSYFSPLRNLPDAFPGSTKSDYFSIKLTNSGQLGQVLSGTLKIKRITIKEIKENCNTLARTNPALYKSVKTSYTIPAYYRAVPFGEVNALVTPTPSSSPALPSSSGKTTIFSHDTDSLDPLYHPAQNEIIGSNASNDSAKTIATTAAKGEKKRVYFSLHNNSAISNLAVSVSDFAQGETPPEGGVSPTPVIEDPYPTPSPRPSPSPTPSITATVTHTLTVTSTATATHTASPTSTVIINLTPTPTTTASATSTATSVPGETESFSIPKGWTTVGPKKAFNTSDFSSKGLFVYQMYGGKWKIARPGGNNFYTGAPTGLYVYNPSNNTKNVVAKVVDTAMVPATDHIKTGFNLLYNNSDSGVTAGKFMVKIPNGGVTQSASLYSLTRQNVASNSTLIILSTTGVGADNYRYADLSKSGTIIPAKKAFWFYMFEDWPKVSQAKNANTAYAADVSSSAVTPTGTVDSMRLKAKQPSDSFTGTYSLVNEIVESFTQMSNTAQKNLAAGRNESFSVEINVPGNITAGSYAANVNITVDGQQQTLPLKIRVRDFTLANISSPRIVFPPNEIWKTPTCKVTESGDQAGQAVTSDCSDIYSQIDDFTNKMLDSGFNGFELSGEGKGQKLGQILGTGPEITEFTMSPASEYLFAKAKTDSRITSPYLINYQNLVGEIMFRRGDIDGSEEANYIKQSIMLKMELPSENPESLYHGNTDYDTTHSEKLKDIKALDDSQIGEIKEQVKTVLDSIEAKIAEKTGKSNFWEFYPVDEALSGKSNGELSMGNFYATTAKSKIPNLGVFLTGNKGNFQKALEKIGLNFNEFCFTGGSLNDDAMLNLHEKTPCFYGGGAYAGEMGSEIVNRYISGLLPFNYGVNYMLFWKYTSNKPWGGNQMDDFDQIGDNGRDWLTEYYNNEKYRASYAEYYGTREIVDRLAESNKYQNITTQEFIGLEEANTDIKYLETLAGKIGWDAVQAKLNNLPADLKLPKTRRTLYGVNMTKEKLNKIRDLIADEIEP